MTFEEAMQQIVDAIRAGDLRPGDRLPSERSLAKLMEISRPTLREATGVLAHAGVIAVKPGPGGGMFVKSDVIPVRLLEEQSELRIGEVAAVLEARRLIEPRVAQLASLYGTDEDFDFMRLTIEIQRGCVDEPRRFTEIDLRFHLAIARATRNDVLVGIMRSILSRIAIARDMLQRAPGDAEASIDLHERTLAAILGGDDDEIDAVMDEHLGYLERIWEEESSRKRLRRLPGGQTVSVSTIS
jgi:GntR family transcriptional regulator, transcriptional repressor for pyruvate dehydrogenase complex